VTTPPKADAFYVPLGDGRFASTGHTGGPWDPNLQHAGPPSALLTRAIEQAPAAWPATLTRVTVDLLGPVPVAELDQHVEVLRSGRSVELVQAELSSSGRVAARATAWRVRRSDLELPPLPDDHDQAPGDEVPPMPDAETALPEGWWRLSARDGVAKVPGQLGPAGCGRRVGTDAFPARA